MRKPALSLRATSAAVRGDEAGGGMSKTEGAMMLCERQGEKGELDAAIEANLRELGF